MIKRFSALLAFAAPAALAASFNVTGNYRFGTNMFSNLDLAPGVPTGSGNTSSYWEHRLLLRPDVVVDDRFTIKSEWNVLQSAAPNAVPENFGSALDGSANQRLGNQYFYIRRAWLEWASDWGIFRVGRMPKAWGLGLLYHAGLGVHDDFGTTVDRAAFQALLGNLGLNLAYEKAAEGFLNNDFDDAETYEMSLEYSNPESLFDVGLLYDRNVRGAGSSTGLTSSHDLSIFAQKRWDKFQMGGEFASISQDARANRMGVLVQLDFLPESFNIGYDFAFASAASDGAFTFHSNYQPFLILFRQSLGPTKPPGQVRGGLTGNPVGSALANGDGAGALVNKANVSYNFEGGKYILGTDLGFASLVRQGTNASKNLGFEADLHLSQKWYDNFTTYYALGFLFPGEAFGAGSQTSWGVQLRGALAF